MTTFTTTTTGTTSTSTSNNHFTPVTTSESPSSWAADDGLDTRYQRVTASAVELNRGRLTSSTHIHDTKQTVPQRSHSVDPSIIDDSQHGSGSTLTGTTTVRLPRKPSPGLAARMKLLDLEKSKKSRVVSSPALGRDKIGRIPESQIRGLDSLHQSSATLTGGVEGRRRGLSQNSAVAAFLTPQVTGDSAHMTSVTSTGDSDRSSEVDYGDRTMAAEDSTSSDDQSTSYSERHKFRLPEYDKLLPASRQNNMNSREDPEEEEPLPPPPLPKDSPRPIFPTDVSSTSMGVSSPGDLSSDTQSYFNPFGLQRTASIYTLSRVSFSDQLSQLTSLQLPQASSLSSSISSIPTSQAAAKALTGAAEQIRRWIQKSSEVLGGLNAEDDVEWAAAGGREGLGEVDNAVTRFEVLIGVYVGAIEKLQLRNDIASVPKDELQAVVSEMDKTLKEWAQVRKLLKGVKEQVELAMEWEELWGVVLGDIGMEMQALSTLVFEMEERRHKSLMNDRDGEGANSIDIGELETIVEETPLGGGGSYANHRLSLPPSHPMMSPVQASPSQSTAQDDSSLLALFARMQPLRASLDFLPMRLSTFLARAQPTFPTACEELELRRQGLEKEWKKLEADAEALRRELGEDRWVLVFRNAGRQAQKMCESVARSLGKLKEAIDAGTAHNNSSSLSKKVESYEAKKMHYGPAIERVLAIIEKGLNERLTVNGEILKLHSDMQSRWRSLESDIRDMDSTVAELNMIRNEQLRDSISSIISLDRSIGGGSGADTPESSPPSSVVATSNNLFATHEPSTPGQNGKSKSTSSTGSTSTAQRPSTARRHFSMPPGSLASNIPRKTPTSKLSDASSPAATRGTSPSPRSSSRNSSLTTPTPGMRSHRPSVASLDGRPRWSSSVNTNDLKVGHNFKPLTITTPSPHRKLPVLSRSAHSTSSETKIPLPSPLSRDRNSSLSPGPSSPSFKITPRPGDRSFDPSPSRLGKKNVDLARPRLKTQASSSHLQDTSARRKSSGLDALLGSNGNSGKAETENSSLLARPKLANRPASAQASGRRSSFLPQPKAHANKNGGRESPMALAGAKAAMGKGGQAEKDRPKWK